MFGLSVGPWRILGWAAALAGSAVAVLLALGAGVRSLTRARMVDIDQLPTVPVALVLGAEVYADGRPSSFLRARLDLAVELYRRRLVEQVLVSGDGRSRFYNETGGMRAYLLLHGVPETALVLDPAGLDTYDSCLRARDVFGVRKLVVVSQSYHLPRALVICRALGLDAWGVGDDTVRSHPRVWAHATRRELAANVKLVMDLISHRPAKGFHQ
ncbi:MAG: SanA/YdcF family protein [Propionicimonas sp.]